MFVFRYPAMKVFLVNNIKSLDLQLRCRYSINMEL